MEKKPYEIVTRITAGALAPVESLKQWPGGEELLNRRSHITSPVKACYGMTDMIPVGEIVLLDPSNDKVKVLEARGHIVKAEKKKGAAVS